MCSLPSQEFVHKLFETAANCLREARKLPLEHDYQYFEAFPEFNAQLQSQRAKLSSLLKRLCKTESLPYSNVSATAHACLQSVDAVLETELHVPADVKKSQVGFADLIDNSSEPFQLKHPFAPQIKKLTFKLWPEVAKAQDAPARIIETREDLVEMCEALAQCREVSVHAVQHSVRSYQGFVCWVALSSAPGTFLLDTLKLRGELEPLERFFSDAQCLKVLHDKTQLLWLQRDFKLFAVNVWDTALAASALDLPSTSLTFLLSTYCRAAPRSVPDWRERPTTPDCTSYLSAAAMQLLLVKDFQAKELQLLASLKSLPPQQLLTQVYQSCQEASLNLYSKPVPYTANRTATDKLLKWRDWTASQLDESPEYILPIKAVADVIRHPESVQSFIAPEAQAYVPFVLEVLLPKARIDVRTSSDLFEVAGWVSSELPYARDYAMIAHSSSLRPEIFNTGLSEDCDADDLRVCLEVYKQFNARLPEKSYVEAPSVSIPDSPEDLDTQLDALEVDENEIPKTMQQIYERSNRNRKKNKTKNKATSATEVVGPVVDVDLPALMRALGWNSKAPRAVK